MFRIFDILVWIWIRIRGSMPLTNRSGSFYFHHWPSRCQQKTNLKKNFWIRRVKTIRWVWLLPSVADPDPPDPRVFGPHGSGSGKSEVWILLRIRILLSLSKNGKKNLDFYCFVISFWLFTFGKWCKSIFKKYYAEKPFLKSVFLLASWRSMMKIDGSGSIRQRHGSADPDSH